MKQKFIPALVFLAAIYTLQTFDIPPIQHLFRPKTCCGRTVCLCSHDKGAPCPFRQHHEALKVESVKNVSQSTYAPHQSCHLKKDSPADFLSKVKNEKQAGFVFGKAPCHKDAPASVLTGFCKDFILTAPADSSLISNQIAIPSAIFNARILLWQQGIDRPPRLI